MLSLLPKSGESKLNSITIARDLITLKIDEIIGKLKIYEMKKQQEQNKKEPKKEKTLAVKAAKGEVCEEDEDMTYMTKRFLKVKEK